MAFQRFADNIDVPNRKEVAWGTNPGGYNPQFNSYTLKAGAAVAPYRIVKFGADPLHAIQGAAAGDTTIGIAMGPVAAAAEDFLMVCLTGIGKVEAGGTFAAGDRLTTDSVGRAVVSSAATDNVIGIALDNGSLAAIVAVNVAPSFHG